MLSYTFLISIFAPKKGQPWVPPLPPAPIDIRGFFRTQIDLDFWSILGANFFPSWSYFGTKNPSKTHLKSKRFFDRFFDATLVPQSCPNGSQNHPKFIKNISQTESGLKNVIFSEIAPRLGETLIFESSRSQKRSQNRSKTVQEPIKNPTNKSIDVWIDFLMFWAPFWLSK